MAYVPVNINVYAAAFAGAMAGIVVPNGAFITDPTSADYAPQAAVASAYAAAVDTAWGGVTVANAYDIAAISEASTNIFSRGAGYPFNAALNQQSNWTRVATAVVVAVLQGDVNATGQGIVLPAVGGGGGGIPVPATSQQVFVAKWGNDGTGNGTMTTPYLTINHALTTILDATSVKRYEVVVFPGIYTENIAFKAFVDIVGWEPTATQGFYPAEIDGTFTLGASFSGATGQETRVANLDLNGTVTLDFSAFPAANGSIDVTNCNLEDAIAFTTNNNSPGAALNIYDSLIWAALTQIGGSIFLMNTSGNSPTSLLSIAPAAGSNAFFQAFGGGWAGDVTVAQTIDGVQVRLESQGFSMSRGTMTSAATALTAPIIKANLGDTPENVVLTGAAAVLADQMRISHQFPNAFPNPTAIAATGTTTIDLVVPAALIGTTSIETMQCSFTPVGSGWQSFIGPHNCSVTFTVEQAAGVPTIHVNIYNPGAGFNIVDICNLNFSAYLPLVL